MGFVAPVDHEITVQCAVRYCLGRRSYAPAAVMDYALAVREQLSQQCKETIVRDINEFFATELNAPMQVTWEKFSEKLLRVSQ